MHHISRARSLQQERIERVAVFIDGANLYAASRTLGFDVDYKNLLAHFRQRSYLVRAYYYTALPEIEEYSPLRPLVDWLGYNQCCSLKAVKPLSELSKKPNFQCVGASREA